MSAPYQKLRTADGYLVVGANSDRLWTSLCAAIERPDLLTDERFGTNADRVRHRDVLADELERSFARRGTDEWVAHLLAAGIPAGPIRDYRQVCDDPHTAARDMVVTVDHPTEGPIRNLGIPVKLSGTPGTVRRPPPLLGEHTTEVLAEAGFTDAEVTRLREDGIIA